MFYLDGCWYSDVGIIGQYIGKIYNETKKRPRYIIADNLMEKEKHERK